MNKIIDTKISVVTVYLDRALVTRTGTIQLTGEERELMIIDLPLSLETNSVRVAGSGTVATRLLGVRTELNLTTEPVGEKVSQLQEQIHALEAEKRTVRDRLESVRLQSKFIETLSEQSVGKFSLYLAKQEVSLVETQALLDFIGENSKNYANSLADLEKQEKKLDQRINVLRQQLKQIQNVPIDRSYRIIATIEPSGAGEFTLEVSYLVNNASWTPLYDLEVSSESNSLNLTYLAEVQQNTGEDWLEIDLILSSAKPGLGSLPPKLKPWYIDVSPPPVPNLMRRRQAKMQEESLELMAMSPSSAAFEPAAELEIEAEIVTAQVTKTGSVVTFAVGGGGNIPSDGNSHKVTIFSDRYPSSLDCIAIPKLVSFAYLQATITNPPTGVTLLPGKANIFRDNVFIGTTELENIAPGQTFQLDLGIEERLKIERELIERQVDKKLIGNIRRITYAYRLKITNLLEQTTTLKLTEQLPISRNEKLKVRLDKINPKIEPKDMGILQWEITLAPQQLQEVYYQFIVEYAPDLTVFGLDI